MGGILPVPDEQTIERTWFLLDNDGYFNDESSGLGATVLKHHLGQVEAALRTRGYCGPALETGAKHYPGRGGVYWVYDPDRRADEEALARTDEWIKQRLHSEWPSKR